MHKIHVDARINISATQETPPAHPCDRRRVLGAAGNHAAGQQAIEDQNIVNRPNTSLSGAQPDRKRTCQHGDIDAIHTHATSEPINSSKCPVCSTHTLTTAHESKWRGLNCPVSPDFCFATKLGTQLGIHRVEQQLGNSTIFKTLEAHTRPHGCLRQARRAQGSGRQARAKTAPRGVRQALATLHAGRMGGIDRMFIKWQPPKGENDDYDNKNFWISG